jgi:hypothetical protein
MGGARGKTQNKIQLIDTFDRNRIFKKKLFL